MSAGRGSVLGVAIGMQFGAALTLWVLQCYDSQITELTAGFLCGLIFASVVLLAVGCRTKERS